MNELSTDLIVVRQLPVIEERLRSMSDDIDKAVSEALALVCTEDTVKSVKAIRAGLTKQFSALEDQRKAVKSAVLSPYEAFDKVYKEFISDKFKAADADLKRKIDEVETGLKEEKSADVRAYFSEYAQSKDVDFVLFERAGINVTLTASIKSLKAAAKDFLDKVSDELALIDTQEHKAEILVEYKESLNVANAITKVSARHAAIEEERKRQEDLQALRAKEQPRAAEVEALSAPEVVTAPIEEPLYEATFIVTASLDKLRALKAFLEDGGYSYESK